MKRGDFVIDIHYADSMRREEEWFFVNRPNGSGDYIFIYFPVPVKLVLCGEEITTEKNACVFLGPDDAHKISGAPQIVNSFVHFGIDEELPVPTCRVFYPEVYASISESIKRIKRELMLRKTGFCDMADALMREIFVHSVRSIESGDRSVLRTRFENLRIEILSHPENNYNVDEMAESLGLSRTRFYEYYRRFFSSSPKKDMMSMKMEKAATLLSDRSKTVKSVAKSLGFKSVEHFTRYYREYFEHAPRRTRRQ